MDRLSGPSPGRLCRLGVIDACDECRILLSRRSSPKTPRACIAIALDESIGDAGSPKWMALDRVGYDRKYCISEQLHQGGISALSTTTSLGLASHALLEKADFGQEPGKVVAAIAMTGGRAEHSRCYARTLVITLAQQIRIPPGGICHRAFFAFWGRPRKPAATDDLGQARYE